MSRSKTNTKTTKARTIKQKKSHGAQQAQQANAAQQKALLSYYQKKILPTNLGTQAFRVTGLLRRNQRKLTLNGYFSALTWEDLSSQVWLQGSISLSAVSGRRDHLQIGHGDIVRNEVWWGGRWLRLWDMRIWDPDRALQAGVPQLTATLYDDLYLLSISDDNFHYTNKYCHEILIDVAQKYKIPLGRISMGTYKIKKFTYTGISPVNAIINAYQTERNHSGRRFVMRWNNGKLDVTPMRRNPILYTMRQQLVDATIHHTTPDNFATSLTGRSSVTNSKTNKVKKHAVTVNNLVETYGFVHHTMDFGSIHDDIQLQKAVKRELTKRQQIGHSIDFDHQGIAVVRKGDAVEVEIPEEGYTGWRSIVWVTDVTHTLGPGSYVMTPTVVSAPPVGMPILTTKSANQHKSKAKRKKVRIKRKRHLKAAKPKGPKGTRDPNHALGQLYGN